MSGSGSLWVSVIAVAGTLLGVLVTGVVQAVMARAAHRRQRAADLRTEAVDAVTALLTAVADHRRAMWVREELRLTGGDQAAQDHAREASHVTRSAITAPLAKVSLLVPDLGDAADAAVRAIYAMRNAADLDTLAHQRAGSLAAEDMFRKDAARVFALDARRPKRGEIR